MDIFILASQGHDIAWPDIVCMWMQHVSVFSLDKILQKITIPVFCAVKQAENSMVSNAADK